MLTPPSAARPRCRPPMPARGARAQAGNRAPAPQRRNGPRAAGTSGRENPGCQPSSHRHGDRRPAATRRPRGGTAARPARPLAGQPSSASRARAIAIARVVRSLRASQLRRGCRPVTAAPGTQRADHRQAAWTTPGEASTRFAHRPRLTRRRDSSPAAARGSLEDDRDAAQHVSNVQNRWVADAVHVFRKDWAFPPRCSHSCRSGCGAPRRVWCGARDHGDDLAAGLATSDTGGRTLPPAGGSARRGCACSLRRRVLTSAQPRLLRRVRAAVDPGRSRMSGLGNSYDGGHRSTGFAEPELACCRR